MLILIFTVMLFCGFEKAANSSVPAPNTTGLQPPPFTPASGIQPSLSTPAPVKDLLIQYHNKTISTSSLLIRLNMTSSPFDMTRMCPSPEYSCTRICPLDDQDQERAYKRPCYCDTLCFKLGDCCFDYFLRCKVSKTPKKSPTKQKCIKTNNSTDYGFVMISSCPSNNPDQSLNSLCVEKPTATNLLRLLPVTDMEEKLTYKNVFCSKCNHAKNQTYWKFSASCKGISTHNVPKDRSQMLEYIMTRCEWEFKAPTGNKHLLKQCLAIEQSCSDPTVIQAEPLLPDLCSFYAFPVCYSAQEKNPHCEICKGKDISAYSCACFSVNPPPPPPPPTKPGTPPLDILFDFSSSFHTIRLGKQKTVVMNKLCAEGTVFDPFTEKCIQVSVHIATNNESSINCSFVEMELNSVRIQTNGSVWIPLHKQSYGNESFFINGSSLFLCMNLSRNYVVTETVASRKITPRQVLTYIGCTTSIISLLFLLGTYIAIAELRNLPGKNLMNLSCAMLLYHTMFFLSGETDKPHFCMTVSILLHYFLLCSFFWMGVLAFDVAKTFGATGQPAHSRSSGNTNALMVYCAFAWITPALVVITSVTLDKTDAFSIGYGDIFCWISNGKALLLVLGLPVAVIIIFNIAALSYTMASIWKVKKTTRHVTSNETSLLILYLKLSSSIGFTWILGFIVPFAKVEFLNYLFVILNSLQGFFIFLAFVANKRTYSKIKAYCVSRFSPTNHNDTNECQSGSTHVRKIAT